MERCCGSCIYHEHEDDVDYRCVCADSDKCDKYTMSRDCCDHWQGWYYNEMNEDGSGAFYLGDCDEEDTCISRDLYVNAWMPLPGPYRPGKE